MTTLKVLSVASEIYLLVKTGGLADVVGALPLASTREGVSMTTLVPGYLGLIAKLDSAEPVHSYLSLSGGPAQVLAAKAAALDLFVLDARQALRKLG